MSARLLAAAYLLIGLVCAMPELLRIRKRRAPGQRVALIVSALMTVILWPLWAPFALTPRQAGKRRPERRG